MRRVVVTGIGIISPVGTGAGEFFGNLMAGVSGVKRITEEYAGQLSVKVAAAAAFNASDHFAVKQVRTLDRTTQTALVAAVQAWNDSGLSLSDEEKTRAGVYIGTGMGGAQTVDDVSRLLFKQDASRVNPLSVTKIMCNASASHISMKYGLTGPCLTFSVACASSAVAVGEAFHRIKYGQADVILAGGTECMLTFSSFKSWESLGVLALEDAANPAASCKPFAKDRTGFVLGEGAAVIVLEEMKRAAARGATIYGEVSGYGITSDAGHITSPTVEGQSRAMLMALGEAGVSSGAIDYINAHGTATSANDVVETQAIKKTFGQGAYAVPVSSTKSMHGHLMGAGGAVEFIASLLALRGNAVPPTMNLREPDPACDLDYVANEGRTGLNVRTVMSNSFAFGGSNAVLIARKV